MKEIYIHGVLAGAIYKTDDGLMAEVYAVEGRFGVSLEILGFVQDPKDPAIYWRKKKEVENV